MRLRFFQLGTGSWYWGVDNLAFYDVSAPETPQLGIAQSGNNLTIWWTATGSLLEAAAVTGPWALSANQANPQTVSATGNAKFYRVGFQ